MRQQSPLHKEERSSLSSGQSFFFMKSMTRQQCAGPTDGDTSVRRVLSFDPDPVVQYRDSGCQECAVYPCGQQGGLVRLLWSLRSTLVHQQDILISGRSVGNLRKIIKKFLLCKSTFQS